MRIELVGAGDRAALGLAPDWNKLPQKRGATPNLPLSPAAQARRTALTNFLQYKHTAAQAQKPL